LGKKVRAENGSAGQARVAAVAALAASSLPPPQRLFSKSDVCDLASLLPSLGDPTAAACAAGAFCAADALLLPEAEVRRVVFEDVPHAGASNKNAQLASRQCRMVSFKPKMASLRMMDY
jgi:hypothetical protein